MRTAPAGTSLVALSLTASAVILSSVSLTTDTFISFGETQGMSPRQYSTFSLGGVPPPQNSMILFSRFRLHVAGIFPSHSTPESL
jgi:hypothetical protein